MLNLYINYFLVSTSSMLLRRKTSRRRILIGAVVGAFGALVILLPELPFAVVFLEKIILCSAMTFISFGKQKASDFLVSSLVFLTVNFVFAGLMLALWQFVCPYGMYCANGVCTFDIPLLAVAAFTIAAYFTVKLVQKIFDKRTRVSRLCTVKITNGKHTEVLKGLCDTGCKVRDIFSGKRIVVCNAESINEIVPEVVKAYLNGNIADTVGIKLVPYSTVSSESLMPVFYADRITINDKTVDALVGISSLKLGEDIDCVFNPEIISL